MALDVEVEGPSRTFWLAGNTIGGLDLVAEIGVEDFPITGLDLIRGCALVLV